MPYMIIFLTLIFSATNASSSIAKNYDHFSPDATVIISTHQEIQIKTKRNTLIQILLDERGKLVMADGVNLNRGDLFYPGHGLLNLDQVETKMNQQGERIYGKWRLIEYQEYGWIYQVNVVTKNGESLFHLINAYTGQFIGSMAKLAPLLFEGQVAKD